MLLYKQLTTHREKLMFHSNTQTKAFLKYADRCLRIDLTSSQDMVMHYFRSQDLAQDEEQDYRDARDAIKLCHYCHRNTTYYKDSTFLYGVNNGPVYHCNCKETGVYVKCHIGDSRAPLGYPADKFLRTKRSEAHRVMDPIWEQFLAEFGEKQTKNN